MKNIMHVYFEKNVYDNPDMSIKEAFFLDCGDSKARKKQDTLIIFKDL